MCGDMIQEARPDPRRLEPALHMTLDHDSGVMEGEVTAGPYRGARLSELSPEDLDRLMAGFEAEAYRVLGLAPGASREAVRAAHSRLIRRVHPDLGGSGTLAALINAARDLLDRDD